MLKGYNLVSEAKLSPDCLSLAITPTIQVPALIASSHGLPDNSLCPAFLRKGDSGPTLLSRYRRSTLYHKTCRITRATPRSRQRATVLAASLSFPGTGPQRAPRLARLLTLRHALACGRMSKLSCLALSLNASSQVLPDNSRFPTLSPEGDVRGGHPGRVRAAAGHRRAALARRGGPARGERRRQRASVVAAAQRAAAFAGRLA